MNSEEKKNKLFKKLSEALKDRVNLLNNIHFSLINITLIEYYKDIDTLMVKLINKEIEKLYLVIFMKIDTLNLDIDKTEVRFYFYKEISANQIKDYNVKEELNFSDLKGNTLNEKMEYLIEKIIASYDFIQKQLL